jgi:hypothetical protein
MPLTGKVTFKAQLQKGNRIQVPKLIRWLHKLEPTQILKVTINVVDAFDEETFITRMGKGWRHNPPNVDA